MMKKYLNSDLTQAYSFQRKGWSELSRGLEVSVSKCVRANLPTLVIAPVMRSVEGDINHKA